MTAFLTSAPNVELAVPFFWVRDLERSIRLYVDERSVPPFPLGLDFRAKLAKTSALRDGVERLRIETERFLGKLRDHGSGAVLQVADGQRGLAALPA